MNLAIVKDVLEVLQAAGGYGIAAIIGVVWYFDRQKIDAMWKDQLALARESVAASIKTEAALEALTDALERRKGV